MRRAPRIVAALVLTAVLPGPLVAFLTPLGWIWVAIPISNGGSLYLTIYGAVVAGSYVSIPAAVANALVLEALARNQIDSRRVAGLVGAAIGLVPALVFNLWLAIPFVIVGGIMGMLYWRIAVLPLRQLRLGERLLIAL